MKRENAQEQWEEKLVELLVKKHLTVTTAESCTGGLIAATLVNVAGVSSVFMEGFITYANEAKISLLQVKKETLASFGAVSEETAKEMALGAVGATGANCSIVSTGIAGPDGGTAKKPVGLVYLGCAHGDKVWVEECHFTGSRQEVRYQAAQRGIQLLVEVLEQE